DGAQATFLGVRASYEVGARGPERPRIAGEPARLRGTVTVEVIA
ncbi:MAG: hypothetical protein QOG36_987, partial [Actinomycetota bacterium]|nr:hypothetical protein [Actinomycetota bacterium]